MVNQIARNFETMEPANAAEATADHLLGFWDPRMKAQIVAHFQQSGESFTPIAAQAVQLLYQHRVPIHQTQATLFNAVDEVGHSDAG